MQGSKKTGNPSKRQVKVTVNKWKEKAIARRKENEKMKKRIKELRASRDNWKSKYKAQQNHEQADQILQGQKAARHQYSLQVVQLVLELYKYGGMSLRSCRHSLSCMFICIGLTRRLPSVNSMRNWVCKCGVYRVKAQSQASGEYVLFIDESISFGSEKILLVLGINREKIRINSALSHEDMEVLYVGISHQWTGKAIWSIVDKISVDKNILYAVSDEGRNLVNAYKLLKCSHIKDCTHKLSNYIKRLFEKDRLFESFRSLIGQLRKAWNLSKAKSQYMPPSMRGKLRFANIFPCVNWAKKLIAKWDELSKEVQQSLVFLQHNKDFIQTLWEVETIFKTVCATLKKEGFGIAQKQKILAKLDQLEVGQKAKVFLDNCRKYLEELTEQLAALEVENLLCTSDIIESYFGKFKYKVNTNNPRGLTEFVYTIATFGKSFSIQETKQALETIQCKHLKLNDDQAKAA